MASTSLNIHDIARDISSSISVNSTYFEKHTNFSAFMIGNLVIINAAVKIKATLPSTGNITVLSGVPISSHPCMGFTTSNAASIKGMSLSKAANSSNVVRTWADQGVSSSVGDAFQGYLIYSI